MKIALVSHTPNLGGAERMLLNLAQLFRNDPSMYIVIIHPALNGEQPSGIGLLPALCDSNKIDHYPVNGTSNYVFINKNNLNRASHENEQYQKELEKAFIELAVDVVLVNTLTSAAPVMAARSLGLPVALWVHGILDTYLIDKKYDASLRLLIDRILINLCNETVCCSTWTARYYEAVTQKTLQVIPNWTETKQPLKAISKECTDFVCLTTLDEQKGVYVLLDAARRLREQNKAFCLHIYGDGVEKERILSYISQHGLKNCVILHARVQSVDAVYNSAMCVMQPSFIESFGMTVLEGMAYGLPVIATASGGPNELIEDGVTGFLVPKGDSAAMAEKMIYLMEHLDEARVMGQKGNARYQALYSPSQATLSFHALFERLYQSKDTELALKPLLDDTLAYLLKYDDTQISQVHSMCLRYKNFGNRLILKARIKLGRVKHKLFG